MINTQYLPFDRHLPGQNEIWMKFVVYWGTWVWVKFKVPKYGSMFLSTDILLGFYLGLGSQVWVQVPEYGSHTSSLHTRDLFRCRFPSTGIGSRVRVQVPEYGFLKKK